MDLLKKSKNVFLIIGVVLVGYLLYVYVFKPAEPLITATTTPSAQLVGQELINELNRLQSLSKISGDIFTNPAFSNLQDISVQVEPKPVGKRNPFTP